MKHLYTYQDEGDQVERGKPSPDIYFETARKMAVDPNACVCLEDSGNSILARLDCD